VEAAEILEHFQFQEAAKDRQELAGELADVALYLLQLASVTEIDLEKAIMDKIEINKTREWDQIVGSQKKGQEPDEIWLQTSACKLRQRKRVSVFGGSQPKKAIQPMPKRWSLAGCCSTRTHRPDRRLHRCTMEAVSRGAKEAGGHVIGVTCDDIEAWRKVKANSWVMEEIRKKTLVERLHTLIHESDAALALPGGAGTLTESP
jgi:hypothetical protein